MAAHRHHRARPDGGRSSEARNHSRPISSADACSTHFRLTEHPRRWFVSLTLRHGVELDGKADFDLELIESRTLDGNIQELI